MMSQTVLLMFALVFLLQLLSAGWLKSSVRRLLFNANRSDATDLVFFAVQGVGRTWHLILAFSFGTALGGALFSQWIRSLIPAFPVVGTATSVVLYYLVYSFFDYWNHRLWHTKCGWLLHRTHHSAEHFSPLLTHRNHPLQLALEPFIKVWPLVFLSIEPKILGLVMTTDYFYQMLVHADVQWNWGWFGRWILISPIAHRIHHSPLPEHADKNFSTLVLWDRLFDTWYDGAVVNDAVGISEPIHNRRAFWWDLNSDSAAFVTALSRLGSK